jgi:hypothetical protein
MLWGMDEEEHQSISFPAVDFAGIVGKIKGLFSK